MDRRTWFGGTAREWTVQAYCTRRSVAPRWCEAVDVPCDRQAIRNPGIVVGLLKNGRARVVAHGTSGAPDGRLDANTLFEIGSITKVFTGTLLADMALCGELRPEDPVAVHLPKNVTVPTRAGWSVTLADARRALADSLAAGR